ncbi:cytochrome c biogenesis CcdA family protein [Paenibacillus contaminans]|uniref:Cytochrome c biogenesis protein CcdA n=1 Tax=Paenibacillus contaminans TaxID=450362 RepID=A0A329MJ23_9BACL|nr:cytochrome c biogenesis protein CcdA [Paenibacillus contaminans]RAV19558.1 cytochrome c biogenesis protein CcdA [Paenibacillus contaminans]
MDFILAFAAGLLSFLSPCVLPLIPAYLSYMVGSSVTEISAGPQKINALLKAALFVAGFSIVFVLLGISVSSVSRLLSGHLELIQRVGGVLVVIFGIHMTGIFKIRFLYMEKRMRLPGSAKGRSFGSFLMGMAFAIGWTPCIGPILSSILIFAGSMETLDKGVALLAVYSLGMGVPFLLSALLIDNLSVYLRKITRHLPVISIVSGVIVIAMGILIFTNRLEVLGQYGSLFNL